MSEKQICLAVKYLALAVTLVACATDKVEVQNG